MATSEARKVNQADVISYDCLSIMLLPAARSSSDLSI